ncbi:MAG TPA: hypothetical protein VK654_11950 [Nitrospirota bacterium]|nr:hypothetical protein [Nitrospirota bacterium]
MAALFDTARQIEPWLKERGLNKEEITDGMRLLLGDDWETLPAPDFMKRLSARGYTITETLPAFADEMEGLIRGALKMESFRRIIYGIGTD